MGLLTTQKRLIAGLILALLLLGALIAMAYQSTTSLLGAITRIDRSADTIVSLRSLTAQLEVADMSLRSFLVSGEDGDLLAHRIARAEIGVNLAHLGRLIDGADGQRQRLDQIGQLIDRRLALADRLIVGPPPAASPPLIPPATELSALIVATEHHERTLLAQRADLAAASVQRATGTIVGSVALTFLAALLIVLSAHQQVGQVLRAGEERLRRAVADAPFPVLLHTECGEVLLASRAVSDVTGYAPDELVRTIGLGDRHRDQAAPDGGAPERRIRTRSGEQRVWALHTAPFGEHVDGRRQLISMAVDLTDRLQAEQALAGYSGRLRDLSLRLVEVQESERRHIARELHDEIGQALTGLDLTMEQALRSSGDALRQHLRTAQGAVRDLTARVRNLSLDLRPSMLDDLGLVATLHWLFQRYTAQTQIEVAFLHHGVERRFHPIVETAAYRIIQEALTNVARHARVTEVAVQLWGHPQRLGIQIEDAGVGFEPMAARRQHRSLGLNSMRERAELLGGGLVIESTPNQGTLILVDLPLEPAANEP